MKFFLTSVLCLLTSVSVFGQAPRPPTTYLSGLSDVNITSPVDDQPLVYDLGSQKWTNTNTLDDIILQSTTLSTPGTVANMSTAKLQHPSAGDIIDWSGGTLKVLQPIQDSSNKTAVNVGSRQLFGTDGTTIKFQWDSTGVKFPTLTNSDATKFLQTDSSGNVSLVTVGSVQTYASYQSPTALNPTGTTSTTGVMMGMGSTAKITPSASGKVLITITGSISNNSTGNSLAFLSYGSGSAPANGVGPTGTATVSEASRIGNANSTNLSTPFTLTYLATGLTVSTQYWIDCLLGQSSGGTALITAVSVTAVELP